MTERTTMLLRALPFAVVLLAGCARSEDASITVDMNQMAPDITIRNSAEEEITAGAWRESAQENSAALEFADTGGQPLFSLRCGPRGGLLVQRHGVQAAGALSIAVGRERRDVAAELVQPGLLRATLNAGDSLIAALGGAATPIGVRAVGPSPLLLPPGPALNTFVARCTASSQSTPAPAGNNVAGNAAAPAPPAANSAQPVTNGAAAR
jgi:hypothetical protein